MVRFVPPNGGSEVSKAFATIEEAEIWRAEQLVAVAKHTFRDPRGLETILADYWPTFLTERHLRPSSRQTYEAHWRTHIGPALGNRQLGSLRRNEIQSWVNRLKVKPRSAQTILAVLQSCLKAAVLDDLIPKSPAVGVKARPVARRKLVVPTTEQVEAITGAMFGRYQVAVRLAAETGLRQGEILGLRVGDLDLLRRRVEVFRQAQTLIGEIALDLPPKSEAGYRQVPLAPETVEAVALHLTTYPPRSGLVITTSSGAPVSRGLFNSAWTKAKHRAGIDPSLRFHDLRHRYASVLIEAGLDALTVKTLMGHESITQTDIYAHMFPSQSERAAQAISDALADRSGTPSRTISRTKTGITPAQRP